MKMYADSERYMGAIPSPVDIRDYKFKKAAVKMMAPAYPAQYECPVKTAIKDQGRVGSCVAHSAAEILEYHYTDKMSTNFIYGIHYDLYGSDGPGMFPREACRIMHDYGDPEYKLCSGNTEVEEVYSIARKAFADKEVMANSKEHRITKYAKVSSINDIKYALMNYGPVLGAIFWYSDNQIVGNGILRKGSRLEAGHAIVIRGWDLDGWICQNSWGTYWGRKGYFTLPWDYSLIEAYSIIPGQPQDDIETPKFCTFVYKTVNAVINWFRKVFHI